MSLSWHTQRKILKIMLNDKDKNSSENTILEHGLADGEIASALRLAFGRKYLPNQGTILRVNQSAEATTSRMPHQQSNEVNTLRTPVQPVSNGRPPKRIPPILMGVIGSIIGVVVCFVLLYALGILPDFSAKKSHTADTDVQKVAEVTDTTSEETVIAEEILTEVVEEDDASTFSFDSTISGMIGGYGGSMYISNGRGSVTLDNGGKRTLEVESFDGDQLVVKAYYKGKYIGYYTGTYSYEDGEYYSGVFHNVVNGGTVDFELY